jgi:hypothetical protein
MKINVLRPFFGQQVVLVVQGHLMIGVLGAPASVANPIDDLNELVVLTSNDNPLYQSTTIVSVVDVGAVRAYAPVTSNK